MDISDLLIVAERIRSVLERNAAHTSDVAFNMFPRGACGVTSELLGRYLIEHLGVSAEYVGAEGTLEQGTHAWITVGDIIIDLTADQFGQSPVIVTRESAWHAAWEVDRKRPPICVENQWAQYPHNTWAAIIKEMT